jgi:hypothetical protein
VGFLQRLLRVRRSHPLPAGRAPGDAPDAGTDGRADSVTHGDGVTHGANAGVTDVDADVAAARDRAVYRVPDAGHVSYTGHDGIGGRVAVADGPDQPRLPASHPRRLSPRSLPACAALTRSFACDRARGPN